jgi:hypothetical protein
MKGNLHEETHTTNLITTDNVPARHTFKMGLDVDLIHVVTAIQRDRGAIAPPQRFSRQPLPSARDSRHALRSRIALRFNICASEYPRCQSHTRR